VIASFVAYALVVGVFGAGVAWLVERGLARFGLARRGVWIAAIVLAVALPPAAILSQSPVRLEPATPVNSAPVALVRAGQVASSLRAAPELREARLGGLDLDTIVAVAWLLASTSVLAFHALGAWRLHRRSRDWQPMRVAAQAVCVAPDIGPALYGWWRPRVVFPAWLLEAPVATQRFALAHEREHQRARDPQTLAAATLLTALLPWNLPLHWMLRRLRFAMEVDCDARVLRAGADASDYGLALLFVSERQSRSPLGTLALIERPSQLERRIDIMVNSPRHRALVAGVCLALAGTCVFAAAQVAPPARIDDAAIKLPPPPGPTLRAGQAVETLAREKYPELLRGEFDGMPVVVVLLNADFTVAKSTRIPAPTAGGQVSIADFQAIGLSEKEVPYVGATWMALPDQPGKGFLAAYTEAPSKSGERFVSTLLPDTRAVDRAVFEQHFDVRIRGAIPAGQSPWLLLDRSGHVLRTGVEPMNDGRVFLDWLAARYPDIKSQEMTVTPLTDRDGKPIQDLSGNPVNLVSVWLASGSANPAN
jgi:beta-lactamase regulating signal transducer with metallopeptidase domain